MAEPEFRRMTVEEFLDWHERQEERYELVNGFPIQIFPPKGMTGGRRVHNRVTQNIGSALEPITRRRGCETTTHNTGVRTPSYGIRYPDVTIDCGSGTDDDLTATEPIVVVEVSSPSNTAREVTDKLEEYRAHPTIRIIMWVEPQVVSIKLYRRVDDAWTIERYHRLERTIPLPEIGGELSVADIYYGLDPEIGPDLAIVD